MSSAIALLSVLVASAPSSGEQPLATASDALKIPDEVLVDQDRNSIRFFTDLVAGHRVAVQFIFTKCTTICSPMAAVFGKLQRQIADAPDIRLISISLDPAHDDPSALAAFGAKFGRGPSWSLVSGDSARIARVAQAFGTTLSTSHTPMTIIGDPASGTWRRVYGMVSPEELAKRLRALGSKKTEPQALPETNDKAVAVPPDDQSAASERYFTNTLLLDQDGKPRHFYDDLIRGKIVIINFGFTSCSTACSPITANLAQVQSKLGPRVGQDIQMVTVSVDPEHDTPYRLKKFAEGFKVKPGWAFLTGPRADVATVLQKIGGFTTNPAEHSTTVIIGDARTGNFTKTFGMDRPENIVYAVLHINDPR